MVELLLYDISAELKAVGFRDIPLDLDILNIEWVNEVMEVDFDEE